MGERSQDMERLEREKIEKQRHEHERIQQKEQQRQERERVQRDVTQHFEESLRIALQKQQQQLQQKNVGWNPMSSMPLCKVQHGIGRSSPTVSVPQGGHSSFHSTDHNREEVQEMDKERYSYIEAQLRHEHERWLLAFFHQRNEPSAGHSASHPHLFIPSEGRIGGTQVKDMYPVQRASPHAPVVSGHLPKSGLSPSSVASTSGSISQPHHKSETNFSLYGYQPFQHTYITHAQLKAREEAKVSNSMQQISVTAAKSSHHSTSTKIEKDATYERSHSPGSRTTQVGQVNCGKPQIKVIHQVPERSSPMYQPLVGSGGAFKPYEYTTNSGPAPAHQSSSSPVAPGRIGAQLHHMPQDQPQNLVKGDHKPSHDQSVMSEHNNHHRLDPHDVRPSVSSPPFSVSASYTIPFSGSKSASVSNANYSYSLIQQGLVPNPLYIAASHTSSSTTSAPVSSQAPIKSHSGSPQSYSRAVSGSGITSGTPVCRANSAYSNIQMRNNHSYSPTGHFSVNNLNVNHNRPCPQDAHVGNRSIHIQGSSHHSPSPAHMYGSPSIPTGSPHHSIGSTCSPRTNTVMQNPQMQNVHRMPLQSMPSTVPLSPPLCEPTECQVAPLNLQGYNSINKRKSKDINYKKRQKVNEDHLLPPQLHPQVLTSVTSVHHVVAPPELIINPSISGPIQQNSEVYPPSHLLPQNSSSCISQSSERTSVSAVVPDSACPTRSSLDSYYSSSAAMQESPATGSHIFKPHSKFSSESPTSELTEHPSRPASATSSEATYVQSNFTDADGREGADENRIVVSPINISAVSTSSGNGSININHPKLKKAWLQRHSENEDKKVLDDNLKVDYSLKLAVEIAEDSKSSLSCKPLTETQDMNSDASNGSLVNIDENKVKQDVSVEDDSTSSASEMEEVRHVKRKLRIGRKQGTSIGKKQKQTPLVESPCDEPAQSKKDSRKKPLPNEKDSINCKRRGRKTKGRHNSPEAVKNQSSKPLEKPSIAQLRKTGEPFLQDGPCCEVAPRLPKCRECRMTPHQRNKKMPNIFCRFYAYRKLRYGKNGTILSSGFSEPSDATEEDLKLWLPPVDNPPSDIEVETSKFLLTLIGDQFCDLVEMEREAQAMHITENTTITWKKVVQGVREMCDVCEATLFNIHWVCHKCGFVVCIDCYKARKNGSGKGEESLSKDKDQYQWLLCTNRQAHEQEKLMLTQIIANTALWDVGKILHEVRRVWNIPTYCSCTVKESEDGKHSTNGICKLMSAVTKCFSSEKETGQMNGVLETNRSNKKSGKNGVKQEKTISGYSSESGGSPLSWLADVALNSSSKVKDEKKGNAKSEEEDEDKYSDSLPENADGSVESDDEKNENFSTLRELLIRPMGKMGTKSIGTDSSAQKTLTSTLDEVISCVIEERVRKSDKKCKEKQLLHFIRRHAKLRSGRELLPIRSCMLTESSLLYPEIPHVWLGNGKILLLTDPCHSGNMQMFQEQWKRGQPVIVAHVGQKLDENLWKPESFLQEFGDVKNDLLNCLCGTILQNQPMKKFWEGFESKCKRIKDEDGVVMALKLKDWPSSEEFSELLSTRYQDLMNVLPLPQYTHRDGAYNMASRLPDCFVKPDLGPRMYSAYGLISCYTKASTNLHLDVSDAVNILAYVENTSEEENLEPDIIKALEESGCDSSMKLRALENTDKIGAIWHVYNARDADKIRDLLNKVAGEQGAKRDPHHDPIHSYEWYLDGELRGRLYKEYSVESYVIVQCLGDAIFVPAGSPHQVRNLRSCVTVSEDFVSPESIGHSFFLTQEIRNLSDGSLNQDDRLQIKNVIYHAVKDSLALLQSNNPEDAKS